MHGHSPVYLTVYINLLVRCRNTRSSSQRHLKEPICGTKNFRSLFFPYCIKIRNFLDHDIQNIDSCKEFKSKMLSFVKAKSNFIFSVCYGYSIKFISRLRLNFSNLNEQKVCHGSRDGTNTMRDCGSGTVTTLHFILQCQQYQTRLELFNSIYSLDPKVRNLCNDKR